ncbi:hypothetical protein D039_4347B, partial [Vibrio parahaemolyticus EKP-028]
LYKTCFFGRITIVSR